MTFPMGVPTSLTQWLKVLLSTGASSCSVWKVHHESMIVSLEFGPVKKVFEYVVVFSCKLFILPING